MGGCVSSLGLALAVVMNWLNKREHDRIVSYVSAKAEEMHLSEHSRQRFNVMASEGQVQEDQNGPYGVH